MRAVCFLNEQIGWAGGGFSQPYTHLSTGVLLTTRDGGQTWTPSVHLALPALRRLRFLDPQHGWAIACPSPMYPSGVFVTDDGRSWRPLPGQGTGRWLAADLLDTGTGGLAGCNGSLAVVSGGQVEALKAGDFCLRNLWGLRLSSHGQGWLAGDGGLVQMTLDRGASWQAPPGELPTAARQFDFSALATRGPKCWIAGTPGTHVFYTADAGRTWQTGPTGCSVPLRAMAFADDQHGWAAGDLGVIVATSDGGQTWRPQRNGDSRLALLGIFADPDDVPLELLARLAGGGGYFAVVNILGRRDIEVPSRDDVPLADRLHEAVVSVGGCGAECAWQFPLRQAGLRLPARRITEVWDRANDGHGAEALQKYLVRQIRLWRPEVIVTRDGGREADDPLALLVREAVLQAVRQAGGRTWPAGEADAGLGPWSVKAVFAALPPGMHGAAEIVTAQFNPHAGRSLADATAEARGLLQNHFALRRRRWPFAGWRPTLRKNRPARTSSAASPFRRAEPRAGKHNKPRRRILTRCNASPENEDTCRRSSNIPAERPAPPTNCSPRSTT